MIHFTPPPTWHLGPFACNSHSLAFCLGAIATYIWTNMRLPKPLRKHLDNLATYMTLAGILGARLLYILVNFNDFNSFGEMLRFWEGGLVSYGGFLGAAAAWFIYIKVNQLPMGIFCQALGPPALMGWGIGRWGCFLSWNNEYGTVTDVPWAFIVNGDVPRHPVMLYIALGHMTMALVAAKISPKYKINACGLSLAFFGAVRLLLDTMRHYDPHWLLWGSSAISLLFIILGLIMVKKLTYPTEEDYANIDIEVEKESPKTIESKEKD